ncbi:hypothetical protein mRhiFer1_009011 [Rhinolophus ferrumequinum]|uniref:Uncharacterized protein n=1 Tax=Rhinolophus ferrumequinum TaxID=59479 RepID=A0A7J7SXY9_RHIFE|nr:hypothetical protein mRhiFer1_009011 [Rhinolophus ferrumequinum]
MRKSLFLVSGWPSGLRRCVQVAVSSGGVGSNPTPDKVCFCSFTTSRIEFMEKKPIATFVFCISTFCKGCEYELGLFFFVLLVGDWSQIRKQLRSTPMKTIFFPLHSNFSGPIYPMLYSTRMHQLFLPRAKQADLPTTPPTTWQRPQARSLHLLSVACVSERSGSAVQLC